MTSPAPGWYPDPGGAAVIALVVGITKFAHVF